MTKHLLIVISFVLASCATTMPGNEVATGTNDIAAVIGRNNDFSNERIQMYQVSLMNNTNEWVEMNGANLGLADSSNTQLSVLVGNRLSAWMDACSIERKVTDHNIALAFGSLAIVGAGVAAGSNHSATSKTGAIVALGSIGGLAAMDFQKSKNKAEFQNAFPDNHIFQSFIIPPKKVVQKWILIENPQVETFKLNLKDKNGKEINLTINPAEVFSI